MPSHKTMSLLLLMLVLVTGAAAQDAKEVTIPDVWRSPPPSKSGWNWYRCRVALPAGWKGRELTLFVEGVDDAREARVGSHVVGVIGALPPEYRSGIGESARFRVPQESVNFSGETLVEIRTFGRSSRTGFNVAAPVLFAGDQAVSLAGKWQLISEEKLPAEIALPSLVKTEPLAAAEMEQRLKRLPGDAGPLLPAESLAKLMTPDDLEVELVLAEPLVRQPLSIKFDTRGRMWVCEYIQYPEPAGLKVVSRDKFLRSVYDKLPQAPPNHFPGQDRISIHEDTDGDGKFDKHSVFVEGLSLATSVAFDRDGVWVLNPPHLLFYSDKNGDDQPDGDPEVHLEGFGLEDAHSVANSLRWGPDGWLYACQGSTVSADIRRPGTKGKPQHSLGQLIWRYHPRMKRYEVFAEGGGNTFGLEIDSAGRMFSGHNGGNTRGFHYVQGGYSQKGFGKHGELSNPYAFGYFPAIPHHDVPRFSHQFIIYEDTHLPEKYRGRLFAIEPLQGRVVMSDIQPDGSSFKTKDVGYALETKDSWFRPVDLQPGPDGALYIADFYEQRIDHASHYQGRIHRESGRIYRLKAKGQRLEPLADLRKASDAELRAGLHFKERTARQRAAEEIRRRDLLLHRRSVAEEEELVAKTPTLELLWLLAATNLGADERLTPYVNHSEAQVRKWAVRLLGDDGVVPPETAHRLQELAANEPNVEVRSQLASTARRLPAEFSLPILGNLMKHSEDVRDPHVPLLIWWGVEKHADTARDKILNLFAADRGLWDQPIVKEHLLERLMRRYAATGKRADHVTCAKLLELAPAPAHAEKLIAGFEAAFAGRSVGDLPPELAAALAKSGKASPILRLRQGDSDAVADALKTIADEKADASRREQLIQVFAGLKRPECVPVLLGVLKTSNNDGLRFAAITTLQSYREAEVGAALVNAAPQLPLELREAALAALAGRAEWAALLLKTIEDQKLPADQVSESVVRRLSLHTSADIAAAVKKYWPNLGGQSVDEARVEIDRLTGVIQGGVGNPYVGKKLFGESCGKCHVLFNQGGKIGPDLTAFQRDDLRRVLFNVLQPSAEIREGFETFAVQTADGRTLSGFIADQDPQTIVLRTAEGQSLTLPRDEIDELKAIPVSVMPQGLLKTLEPQQIRDLFAYLRSTQPLAE